MTVISPKNPYTAMQYNQYLHGTNNHENHNGNHDYWDILLKPVKENVAYWENKKALDFGCGKGRNVHNLLSLTDKWSCVDGVDISPANIEYCKRLDLTKSNFQTTNGVSAGSAPNDHYDFVMSTIVFQHICVYDIRDLILKDIYRVLNPKGIFSFQMGFGPKETGFAQYYDNVLNAYGTNGLCDVRVSDTTQIVNHLTAIGFKNVQTFVKPSYDDHGHPNWIYTIACKG